MNNTQMNAALELLGLESTVENKAVVVMSSVKVLVDSGVSVPDAFNAVMGKDAYRKLADSVYGEFQRPALETPDCYCASLSSGRCDFCTGSRVAA